MGVVMLLYSFVGLKSFFIIIITFTKRVLVLYCNDKLAIGPEVQSLHHSV